MVMIYDGCLSKAETTSEIKEIFLSFRLRSRKISLMPSPYLGIILEKTFHLLPFWSKQGLILLHNHR